MVSLAPRFALAVLILCSIVAGLQPATARGDVSGNSTSLEQVPQLPPFPPLVAGMSYGAEPYMLADLQLSLHSNPRPLVIYLHGGGGVAGPGAMKFDPYARPWLDFLLDGYPILSAHYGNALTGAPYPAQNNAVRELLGWVREDLIPSLPSHLDGKVVLWGVSQGGLLGLNETYSPELPDAHKPDLAVAWVAPTLVPYLDQDEVNVLATYYTGKPFSTLASVPEQVQYESSPAWTLLQDPFGEYVRTLAAYWVPPTNIQPGSLNDVHHGIFGDLLHSAHPDVTAVYYPTAVGPLPSEIALLDDSFPAKQTLAWIADNL